MHIYRLHICIYIYIYTYAYMEIGLTPGLHNKIPAQDFRQGLGCSGTHFLHFQR